jgi:hypothetical protein
MEVEMQVNIGDAVDWIARNDEAGLDEFEDVRYQVTVIFCADMFKKSGDDIARRVLDRRRELGLI